MNTILVLLAVAPFAVGCAEPAVDRQINQDESETTRLKAELESLRAEVKTLRTELAKLRDQARRTSEKKQRDYGDIDSQIQMLKTPTGVDFAILGEKPAAPAPTVFWFGNVIHLQGVEIVPFLIDHGYLCVTLNAPACGPDIEPGEAKEVMDRWRHRIEAKNNFILKFNKKVSKVLDYLIAEGYTDPERVATVGGSMGGFLAFHFGASDPRVKSIGGHIPLTELRVLREFKGMENDPLTESLSVINLAEKFDGRNVLVIVGDKDQRVITDHSVAFARRVSQVAGGANVELHVMPGGHVGMKCLGTLTDVWLRRHFSR